MELHSLSRAELNGAVGECTAWHPSKGRWAVRLARARASILLRPMNLRRVCDESAAVAAATAAVAVEARAAAAGNVVFDDAGARAAALLGSVETLRLVAQVDAWIVNRPVLSQSAA